MKISVNWVRQFLDFDPLAEGGIDGLVEKIGAQIGAVEDVEDIGAKFRGVVVAKIVSCRPHQDSDHLNVCLIDDGGSVENVERNEDGLVQVVCGAPNVREGLLVAWLPPGSTVPESIGNDPFVLGSRALRGVMSHGMLASPRELALGDSHEGILEIDKNVNAGSDFSDAYKLEDYVIDIENKMFTHRPDCFGVLGVAREIAGIYGKPFHSPDWYRTDIDFPGLLRGLDSDKNENDRSDTESSEREIRLPLKVTNEIPHLVPRYSAVTLADVQIGPSPVWLQVALAKVGQKSISNVVDLTNFYMLVTGQPLHAYDYDKVAALTAGDGAEITVRQPMPGETIKLINGKEIEPRKEAVMIAAGTSLIGLGGVMGGYDSEVDDSTRNIILEAANIDMYSVRRSSMAHGLFTDAVTRFNKGQSPLQTMTVLAKITDDIVGLTGAYVSSEPIDIHQLAGRQWVHPPVTVTAGFVNARLGLDLAPEEMKNLLVNVEFHVENENENLVFTAPFWRTDIETREDVVEEVGRLYGFDHLPLELPVRSIAAAAKDPLLSLKSRVRDVLSRSGAHEVLTYSFVHGDLLRKVGQDPEHAFRIGNALSPDLQYYRLSLTPSLLDKIHMNIKSGYDRFALFELGKSHFQGEADVDDPGVPNEDDHLAFVVANSKALPQADAAYYQVKRYLQTLIDLDIFEFVALKDFDLSSDTWGAQLAAPYDANRSAVIVRDGRIWGVLGEFKSTVRKTLKLPEQCAGFEIHLNILHERGYNYVPIPRFPKVTQDITLEVAADQTYGAVYASARSELQKVLPDRTVADLQPLDIYQADASDKKRLTFRLEIASYERTLTDIEVTKLLDAVAVGAGTAFGAVRI